MDVTQRYLLSSIVGILVTNPSQTELFERHALLWRQTVSVWMDACSSDDECEVSEFIDAIAPTASSVNWQLFSHVLESFVDLLDKMVDSVTALWTGSASHYRLPALVIGSSRNAA